MKQARLKAEIDYLNYLLYKYQGTDHEHMQIDKIKLRMIEDHGFDAEKITMLNNHIIATIEDRKSRATFLNNQKVR